MRTYIIFTFRNKKDVILTKEFYYKQGIRTSVINAPNGIGDVCSFVLNIGDVSSNRAIYLYNMRNTYIVGCYKVVDDYKCEKIYKIF